MVLATVGATSSAARFRSDSQRAKASSVSALSASDHESKERRRSARRWDEETIDRKKRSENETKSIAFPFLLLFFDNDSLPVFLQPAGTSVGSFFLSVFKEHIARDLHIEQESFLPAKREPGVSAFSFQSTASKKEKDNRWPLLPLKTATRLLLLPLVRFNKA